MKTNLYKFVLGVLVVALTLTALPLSSVFAAGLGDQSTPPASTSRPAAYTRLELAFVREKARVARIEIRLNASDARLANLQQLIDQAKANGKDVTAVQTALDNYKAALVQGQPVFAQAQALVEAHAGFDANGIVTDLTTARTTVKNLHATLLQYASIVAGPLRTLQLAVRAFRAANK